MVEPAPGGGPQVVSYDVNALYELYVVRDVLEATAAGEAAKSASEAELRTLEEKHRVTARHFGDIDSFVQENKALRDQIYGAAHNRFLERSRRCTIRWLFSDRRRSTPRSGSNARCFNIREIARVQPGEGHGIHAPAYPQRLRKAPLGAEGRFCSGARPDARIQIDEARAELVGRPRRRR
jgi:hypothetical protein